MKSFPENFLALFNFFKIYCSIVVELSSPIRQTSSRAKMLSVTTEYLIPAYPALCAFIRFHCRINDQRWNFFQYPLNLLTSLFVHINEKLLIINMLLILQFCRYCHCGAANHPNCHLRLSPDIYTHHYLLKCQSHNFSTHEKK